MALRERKARVGAIPEGGMADIAFLLLVFFLVTTTIDMDKGLGIILPAEGQEAVSYTHLTLPTNREV